MARRPLLIPALLVLLLAIAARPAAAALTLTPAVLASKGIDMQMFGMVALSYNGSLLVGIERVKDLQSKRQGIGYLLRVFRFAGGRLARVDTIKLPTPAFEQLALSPDGSRAVAIGEGGSKLMLVDLKARTTSVLWTHRKGTPGFRSEMVAWWRGPVCYLLGYLHDGEDNVIYDGVVRLNLARAGADMFERGLDIRPLQRQLKALLFEMYIDDREAFLGVTLRPDLVEVYHFRDGTLERLDQAVAIGGIASAPGRILYAARFDDQRRDVILRDMPSRRTWRLGRDNLPYNYLFLSADGKTAVLTLMNFRGNTMSYFYAREADGFKVRPLPSLRSVRPGTLRLAPDGRTFAYYGPGGLIYGAIP